MARCKPAKQKPTPLFVISMIQDCDLFGNIDLLIGG
jgi:hypothetical protein